MISSDQLTSDPVFATLNSAITPANSNNQKNDLGYDPDPIKPENGDIPSITMRPAGQPVQQAPATDPLKSDPLYSALSGALISPKQPENKPSAPPSTQPSLAKDVALSAASGVSTGLIGTWTPAGGMDMAVNGANYIARQGARFRDYMSQFPELAKMTVGAPQPTDPALIAGVPFVPPLNAVQHVQDALGIPSYQPKTGLGEDANLVSQVVSGGLGLGAGEAAGFKLAEGTKLPTVVQGMKTAMPSTVGAAIGAVGGKHIGGDVGTVIGSLAGAIGGAKAQQFAANRAPIKVADNVYVRSDQAAEAGHKILDAATNPDYIRGQLGLSPDQTANAQSAVPGAKPTLAEAMVNPQEKGNLGDVGISNWQRNIAQQNPDMFLQRQNQKTGAEVDQIERAGGEGSPQTVTDLFKQQRSDIADRTANEVADLMKNAEYRSSLTGGENAPDLRENLENALEEHNKAESALWKPVEDKYGKAPVPTSPVFKAIEESKKLLNEKGGIETEPAEQKIYDTIGTWNAAEPFKNIRDMHSTIGKVERSLRYDANADPRALTRLGNVKRSLSEALDNASENLVKNEQVNGITPENSLYSKLIAEKEAFNAKRAEEARTGSQRDMPGDGEQQGQFTIFSDGTGTKVQTSGGSGGAAGGESVSPTTEPVDYSQASSQYKAAKAKTLEQNQLFAQGPVGKVLAPGKNGAEYRMPDGRVNSAILQGPEAPAAVKQYIDAIKASGGDEAKAITDIHDAIVNDLRSPAKKIITESGVDSGRLEKWINSNSKTIDAVPGLREKLSNAKAAQDLVNESLERQKTQIDTFDSSEAGKFIGQDPSSAVSKLMAGDDPAVRIAKVNEILKQMPPDNLAARNGFKKAVNDFIMRRVRGVIENDPSNLDISSSPKFRRFISDNRQMLENVYGKDGLNNFLAVTDNMYRKAAVDAGSKTSGQSNTPEDILRSKKLEGKPKSVMDHLSDIGLTGIVAHEPTVGLPLTIAKGVWQKFTGAAKAAHASTIEGLQTVAALHPEVARILVQQADKINPSILGKLTNALYASVPPASNQGNKQ